MNKRQKEVLQITLNDEEAVLKALESNYTKALADIKRNIKELQANPLTQSKAYQLEFQKQLETQVSGILDNLQGRNFTSVADYLQKSYTNGFIGNMYDMQGQGVPLVIPIDESQVLMAVQKTGDDFKLSNKRGISTKELKKQVHSELIRGLATELSYADIARNISEYGLADMNRAATIARTEGHRVQTQARLDSMQKAKKLGADVVKQWDCTLDGKTRPEHSQLDGQIRELDEMFETSGYSGSAPGQFGDPYMDCNCRCCLLQRARWAVKGETTYQKWNNETGGFIECSGYEDFKEKYLEAAEILKNVPDIDITDDGKYKILDFNEKNDYEKYIRPEYYAQRMTWADNSVLWSEESGYIQNADGYDAINKYMRGINQTLDAKYVKTLKVLNKRTSNEALKHDYIGYRKVDCSYLDNVIGVNTDGLTKMSWQKTNLGKNIRLPIPKDSLAAQSIVDSINSIVNTPQAKITDTAVTSISMCENINYFTHRPIQFEIQMPKGTKGLITNNYDESEFIAKAGSSIEILGAKVYNDGVKDCVRIFAKLIQE